MKVIFFFLLFFGYVHLAFSDPERETAHSNPQVYSEPQLHSAIKARDMDSFKEALSTGENLYVRNRRGQSPLTIAILLSDVEMITLLLDKGATLDLQNTTDYFAFKYAARSVRKLLRKRGQTGSFCQRIFRR